MKNQSNTAVKKGFFHAEDISLFCEQLALVLRSGIPLADGIGAIGENIADAKARAIVLAMEQEVAASAPFYEALEHSGAFPNYLVHMVEIGEKAGKLDDVMEALGAHYSREAQLKKNLRSAVLYPLALVLMMSAVIAVLVIKVLPIFNDVFRDLGAEMSDASAFVMNLGVGIAKYAFVVILILAVVLAAALLYSRTSRGSARMARLLSRFGPTKGISARVASARFASVMSMMLTSGYDTDAALELAPKVISNDLVARKIEQARSAVAGGKSFADAVVSQGLFPGIYGQMVSIGMKTGNLDQVMAKLAGIYNEDADRSIGRAVSIVQPVLVGVLSVIIGAILLAVMLPLMGIMSSIG